MKTNSVLAKAPNDGAGSRTYLDVLLQDGLEKLDAQAGLFSKRVDDKKFEVSKPALYIVSL